MLRLGLQLASKEQSMRSYCQSDSNANFCRHNKYVETKWQQKIFVVNHFFFEARFI